MGIDVSHSLMVGCSYKELENFFEKVIEQGETEKHEACEDPHEVIECYFEYASPYYDSDPQHWFIGFEVPNYSEIDEEWFSIIKEACEDFEALTGVKPRIRGGAHVW